MNFIATMGTDLHKYLKSTNCPKFDLEIYVKGQIWTLFLILWFFHATHLPSKLYMCAEYQNSTN
jgi:hypothetical protein